MCAYVVPSARSTGTLITSAIWNQDVVDNVVQHQADVDLIYRRPVTPIIVNGGFQLWQRGTTFAAAASGAITADRWRYEKSGVAVHTIRRNTSTLPTVANALYYAAAGIELECTTVDSSVTGADRTLIQQQIDGYTFQGIAQRGFTLSFWVSATKTGTYCVSFRNSGVDRSYVAEYTVSIADTWEFKTITVSASPSAGTWDYTTGKGLDVNFMLSCGSTLHTTANAWQTGNFLATSNQVNATDSNSSRFFRLWGVQIHPTDAATGISAAGFGYFKGMSYTEDVLRSGVDVANARLGVFEPEPQGKLHVSIGRGTVPSLTGSELGILQNNDDTSDNTDFLLLAGASGLARILFGDAGDGDIGRLVYDHSDNSMDIVTNNAVAATFNSSGDIDVTRYTNPAGRVITNTASTGSLGSGATSSTLFSIAADTTYLVVTSRAGANDMHVQFVDRAASGNARQTSIAGTSSSSVTGNNFTITNPNPGSATYNVGWLRIF